MIKNFLYNNICGGDSESYDSLVAWIRDALVDEEGHGDRALVVQGPAGAGKSFLGNCIIGPMFGAGYLRAYSDRGLHGFNGQLEGCRFLLLNDVNGEKVEQFVHNALTKDQLCIEKRGQEPRWVTNRLHIMVTKNSRSFVTPCSDRLLVIQMPEVGPPADFAALIKHVEGVGRDAFMKGLRS